MSRLLLFVSKGEDSSSTRYRALQFFPLWREAGFEAAHVTASGGLGAILNMLRQARHADVVIVLRKTFPAAILWLLRRVSRRLIFDFDDAIFCNTDGSSSPTRMTRFKAMTQVCDHVFAGNAFLASHAKAINPNTSVIPTCVDVARYAGSARQPTEHIDVVWIGSHSTRKYLLEALPWLAGAAALSKALRLKIIADFDLPGRGVDTCPIAWQAETEANDLASAHIGIAPLRNDDWSRGKCALKVLQYMAAGLPVVSSRAGANAEVIEDGVEGFLVENDDEGAARLRQLAEDPPLRQRMGEAGRRRVAGYSLEGVFNRLREVVDGLI